MEELLRSLISSTLIEFSLEQFIREQEYPEKHNLNKSKLKTLESIVRKCAFMREDQILIVFQFIKIFSSGKKTLNNNFTEDINKSYSFSVSNNFDSQENNNSVIGKEINLSLNSNSNSIKNEILENSQDNSVWEMGDKSICFFKLFLLVIEL